MGLPIFVNDTPTASDYHTDEGHIYAATDTNSTVYWGAYLFTLGFSWLPTPAELKSNAHALPTGRWGTASLSAGVTLDMLVTSMIADQLYEGVFIVAENGDGLQSVVTAVKRTWSYPLALLTAQISDTGGVPNGSVTPAYDMSSVAAVVGLPMQATANEDYTFDHWQVISGHPFIASPTGDFTFITLIPNDEVVVKAVFRLTVIIIPTEKPYVEDLTLFGQNKNTTRLPVASTPLISTFGWLNWEAELPGYDSDIVNKTVGLLIEQFRVDRPKINALISTVAVFCQEIETVLYDLIRFRSIGYASGTQLDKIGEIVGIKRTSDNDDIYRSDIYFQISVNMSSGEPEIIMSALKRVTECITVDYCEPSPAHILLIVNKATKPISINTLAKTKTLVVGGVELTLQYNNFDTQFVFNGDILGDSATSPYYSTVNNPYFTGEGFDELVSGNPSNYGGTFSELVTI